MKTIKQLQITLLILFPILLAAQWSPARFDHNNQFEKTLAIDENNVFLIGRDPMTYKNFFMRTNDGGVTWDSIGIYPTTTNYELNTLFFVNNLVGFMGGSKDNKQLLIRTLDGGDNWANITPDTTSGIASIHFLDVLNGTVVDGWNSIYKTTDGGTTWTTITYADQIKDIHFVNNNLGFASGVKQWTDAALFKTTDGGQTWVDLLSDRDMNLFVSSFDKIDYVDANTMFTYMGNTNRLYRTTDAGATWDTIVVSGIDYIGDFDFVSADTGHLLSLAGQIFITVDGGQNWTMEYATDWGAYGPSVFLYSLSFVGETGYVGGSNGLIKKHTVFTSVEKIVDNSSVFKLYPNPFSANQNLVLELANSMEGATLKICNSMGQLVYQKTLQNTTSKITLSDTNLSAGIYFLTLENDKKISTQKLIVE